MAINITDELTAKTKKGKIASAKEVFLEGDKENLQQIGDKTHQLEEAVKNISVTGGASAASAVSYDNEASGMTAITAQAAIDEIAAKDKEQDTLISSKADAGDVSSKMEEEKSRVNTAMQEEQTRVNAELDKKLDKESVVQEFGDAEDKVVSQAKLPFREIENPEFIHCVVDAEDHLLFGIQMDGSVEWGKGIPMPVREKLEEVAEQAKEDTASLSERVEEMNVSLAESIADVNTYLSEKIQTLDEKVDTNASETEASLETKVDKEEGKSLIADEVKESFGVIENEEWLHAIVDSEGHLLFGIYRETGKPYFPLNEMYHVEQNPEFFAAWIDEEDHLLMGIRRDGQIVGEINAVTALKEVVENLQTEVDSLKESVGTLDKNLQELMGVFSFIESPEFLKVETDSEGRVLASTKEDGSHYAYNMQSETIDAKVDKEEGKSLIDSTVAEVQTTIDDVEERMQITTDAEDRILSYRDKDGVQHEHSMDVEKLKVSRLELEEDSVNDIQSALKANGFDVKTPMDWSESSFIQIPEPRFAIINITNIDSMPTTKTQNKKAYLEFWDMQGNYFKKHAILNAQGNSSMNYVKKNIAVDLCDDEWVGDSTPKIRIGEWVPQDSFHLKAYYTDFFRGVGAVSYKLYDQIVHTRGNMEDRPWKKALIDMFKINTTTKSLGNQNVGDYSLLTDTGARCFPDGFPCAVYLKGTFYGVFSFQLKKHRDNYHLDKSTAEHTHLDGTLNYATIFNGKSNINWTQFEIRNPKGLYTISGNKYDADVKQEEIAGENETNAWIEAGQLPDGTTITSKIQKALQMTAKVKKYIQNFAKAIPIIKEAASVYEASSKTDEDLNVFKKVYETYFDVDNMIDYIIVSDIIKNADGFSKNWQWFTYDGKKWWVGLYDCDMSFGGHWEGNQITEVLTSHLNTSTNLPNGYVILYYSSEMESRYKQLKDWGVLSAKNIFNIIKDWSMRIGSDFYRMEYEKWKNSPCSGDSVVRTDYWKILVDTNGNPQTDNNETFNATIAYSIDDEVSFGKNAQMGYFKFKCIKETVALPVNTPHSVSTYSPIMVFKYCDNIYRIQKWIEQNLSNMDKVYKI